MKKITLFIILISLLSVNALNAHNETTITLNQFKKGSDSYRIEAAIEKAINTGVNAIRIPRYDNIKQKEIWLIDRAILLPSNFTLILEDCIIRLAPGVQDNIITNRGARENPISGNDNINIIGIGSPKLCGGLESPYEKPGDKNGYTTIGLLLYDTKHFVIDGITMEETDAWAISVENGSAYGKITNININNRSIWQNQDGIDIRKGCHDILIENITGVSGDDLIALTGLRDPDLDWKQEVEEMRMGKRKSMHVGGRGWRENDDIYNITIRNVRGTLAADCCSLIRILNSDGIKIYNVFISNITDTGLNGKCTTAQTILIGNEWSYFKKQKNQPGDTYRIFIDNVFTTGQTAIRIMETLQDSRLTNIASAPPDTKADVQGGKFKNNGVVVLEEEAQLKNVYIDAIQF